MLPQTSNAQNVTLAKRCREEGLIFIGPSPDSMEALGDKVRKKNLASVTDVPMIPDSRTDLNKYTFGVSEADRIGLPIMIKAVTGGGGRGMRVVRDRSEFERAFHEARNEANIPSESQI